MATEKHITATISAKNLADKAFREFIALQKEAARVTREVRTPVEQFSERLKHLQAMLDRGAISQETHARAVLKTRDAYAAMTNAAVQAGVQAEAEAAHRTRLAGSDTAGKAVGAAVAGGKSWTEGLAKAYASLSTIDAGLKGILAVSAALNGEWDKVNETLARLPLGIGAIYQAEYELIGLITGGTAKLAEQAEMLERQADTARQNALASRDVRQNRDELEALRDQIELEQMRADKAGEWAIANAQAQQEAERQLRAIARRRSEAVEKYDNPRVRETATKTLDQLEAAVKERLRLRMNANLQIHQANQEKFQAANDAARQKRLAAEQQAADERAALQQREADLATQLWQMRLQAEGRDLEASLVQQLAYWQKRIDAAESGAERETLIEMRTLELRRMLQNEAQREAQKKAAPVTRVYRGVAAINMSERYHGVGERFASEQAQAQHAAQTARNTSVLVQICQQLMDRWGRSLGLGTNADTLMRGIPLGATP